MRAVSTRTARHRSSQPCSRLALRAPRPTKLATVLGTSLPYMPITTRPTRSSPIEMSKNTFCVNSGSARAALRDWSPHVSPHVSHCRRSHCNPPFPTLPLARRADPAIEARVPPPPPSRCLPHSLPSHAWTVLAHESGPDQLHADGAAHRGEMRRWDALGDAEQRNCARSEAEDAQPPRGLLRLRLRPARPSDASSAGVTPESPDAGSSGARDGLHREFGERFGERWGSWRVDENSDRTGSPSLATEGPPAPSLIVPA